MTPVLHLMRHSLVDPRDAGARLLSTGPTAGLGLQALLLVAALGGLLVGVLTRGRLELPAGEGVMVLGPWAYAAVLFVTLTLGSVALAVAGRALGGEGRVAGALALVAWLQVIDLALQVAGIGVALLLPPLAPLAALAGLGALLWCLIGFVQALHGVGPGRAVAILLLAALGLGLALAVLLAVLGVGIPTDA